jgi:dynein heavy chain
MLMYASKFNMEEMLFKRINFSSATAPRQFQDSIEGELERKQGKTYMPPGNKRMTVFIDDISMPFVNDWGDQVTLEITRQLIEQKGFYFLNKENRGDFRSIENLQFLGAMNHPGGGRNDVPDRLKRHFFSINMVSPSQRSIENIYGRILDALFNPKKYSAEIIHTKGILIEAMINLWEIVKKKLLPSPAKFHYVFNMRELSRVFQGVCVVAAKPDYKVIEKASKLTEKMRSDLFLVMLWRHECERVFEDKLINNDDKKTFHDMMDKVTIEKFKEPLGIDDDSVLTDTVYFCDFQREDVFNEYGELVEEAPFVYEAVPSLDACRKLVLGKLDAYNEKNPSKKMSLVIFDDALKHLLRLTRVINMPRGSMLLVGVGGSGKQSLTKLASFICKNIFFQISLTKTYSENNLKDDLKNNYHEAGPGGKNVTFILTDAEIKQETFLEYFNMLLSTGEVAGLIAKDEKDVYSLEIKPIYMKDLGLKGEDPPMIELWNYCINRVRDCLHIILSFSPVGPKFRERARKFPSMFSSCTIDWFLPWPEEALISVSHSFLAQFKIDANEQTKLNLEKHMGKVHDMVTEVCEIYFARMRRHVYVTPKSYLSFIEQYKAVYEKKYVELNSEEKNIRNGLHKLKEAAAGIEELKIDLKKEEVKLKDAAEKTDKLLKELEIENQKAKVKGDEVQIVKDGCQESKALIMIEREEAERDLAIAIPFLKKAESAVDSIKPKDITELKTSRNPVDTTKVILDTVHLLLQRPLGAVQQAVVNVSK